MEGFSEIMMFKKSHRLGSPEEQPLLFSLIHLILCSLTKNYANALKE